MATDPAGMAQPARRYGPLYGSPYASPYDSSLQALHADQPNEAKTSQRWSQFMLLAHGGLAVYGTFRLNFHRFDQFELDLLGHTQP